jgi:hypothetical protein
MSKQEEFTDSFEGETPVAEKGKKVKEPAKLLTSEQCETEEVHSKYLDYLSTIIPIQLGLDPSKKYSASDVWEQMNEASRQAANKAFRKKSKIVGSVKKEVAKSPAHARALAIKDAVAKSMYDHAQENFGADLNELQGLNPGAKLSVEIYFSGWRKFVQKLIP